MATIDDLFASSERIEKALEKLAEINSKHYQTYKNRRLNRNNTSPRQHMWRAFGNALKGNWKGARRQVGKAWQSFKTQKGLNKFGGGAVGKVAGVVAVLDAFRKAVIAASEAAVAAARKYAEVSASMAQNVAQRDIREMMRDMEKGERIADSSRTALEAEQWRKDQHKEIDILGERLQNYGTAILNGIGGMLLAPLNAMAEGINELIDSVGEIFDFLGIERDKDQAANLSEWVKDIGDRQRQNILDQQKIFEQMAIDFERMRPVR